MFLPGHPHAEITSPAMTTLLLEHRSPSPSPRNAAGAAPPQTSSKTLKFGMDRILADDAPTIRRRSPDSDYSLQAYDVHSPSSVSSTWSPGRCCGSCEAGGSRVPCSDCVSSLMRCCSVSAPLAPTPHYPYTSMHYLPVHHNAAHYASMYASPDLLHAAKPSGGSPSAAPNSAAQSSGSAAAGGGSNKRKRSWSRAVFSNLQRKGLEKRFQLQKYITKPDRRQLAATLGLTDAQVKVWFQNRRMKWRHSKEAKIGITTGGVPEVASVTSTLVAGRPNVTAEVRVGDLNNRRAADSTQLECPDISPDDDSDVDIEVTA